MTILDQSIETPLANGDKFYTDKFDVEFAYNPAIGVIDCVQRSTQRCLWSGLLSAVSITGASTNNQKLDYIRNNLWN